MALSGEETQFLINAFWAGLFSYNACYGIKLLRTEKRFIHLVFGGFFVFLPIMQIVSVIKS